MSLIVPSGDCSVRWLDRVVLGRRIFGHAVTVCFCGGLRNLRVVAVDRRGRDITGQA